MKKIFVTSLVFLIVAISAINLLFFLKANYFLKNELYSSIYPVNGWPSKNKKNLYTWKILYNDTLNKVNNINNKIINNYNNFYLNEFYKYGGANNPNIDKPGYDQLGIPLSDIKEYINEKIINSSDLQFFYALSLRSYFIEYTMNVIVDDHNNTISPGDYLNLWVMYYFNAGIYFQWIKTWIQDLGRTIEQSIDIDFYTFGSYVQVDDLDNPKWNEPPKDNKIKPLISLDKCMNSMYSSLYNDIFEREGRN